MTSIGGGRLDDVVVGGGPIFDGARVLPEGTAVAIADGRIVAIGPAGELQSAGTATMDLGGRLLHPGFTDAHVHALSAGVDRNGCDLTSSHSAREALGLIADYAGRTDNPWIVGSGWSMSSFPGGCPTSAALDSLIGDRPAFLLNRDHHGAWVNSIALQIAGIDKTTPDPPDGRIERDAIGAPTGTLHEGAMDLVGRLVPAQTLDDAIAGLLTAQDYLHQFGVTGWQEAIVGDYSGMTLLDDAYRMVEADGLLTAEVVGASWLPRPTRVADVPEVVEGFLEARRATRGGRWSVHAVKIMVDGIVENRTARMADPYVENAGGCRCADRGLAYFDRDILEAVVVACDAVGLDIHFHAIGDAAVTMALDAVERARVANGISSGRHHIAHIQLVDPRDIGRFATLGVSANMQALWACNDAQMVDLVLPAVGPERYRWHYPFGELKSARTHLVMGSDWPVSTPDPWAAISVAVNRVEPGTSMESLLPEQRLDVETALAAYTAGSAWINRRSSGRIRIGAVADIALCSADPFTVPTTELHTMTTDLTVANGVIVYERTSP